MAKRGPKGPNRTSFGPNNPPPPRVTGPRIGPEMRAMRSINAHSLSKIIGEYYHRTIAEVEEILADENSVPAIHLHVCTFISKAIRTCDPSLAKELLDRMCGRPKEQVIISDNRDEELTHALGGVPDKTIVQHLREIAALAA